jgi:CarD family transcriptional regulator
MKLSAAKTGSGGKAAVIATARPARSPAQDSKSRGDAMAAVPKGAKAAPRPAPSGKAAHPDGPKHVASEAAARLGNPPAKKTAAATRRPQNSDMPTDPHAAAGPARKPRPAAPQEQGAPATAAVPHGSTSHKSETVKISTAAKTTDDTLPRPDAVAEPFAAPAPDALPPSQTADPVAAVVATEPAQPAEPEATATEAPAAQPAATRAAAPAPANQSPMRHGGPHRGYSHPRGATGRPTPRPPAPGEAADEDEDDDEGPPRPRLPATLETFAEGDHVVYPTHGVGKVEKIAVEEIAGHKLELIHITFEENRMTLRVPVAKARSAGLRKLATRKMFDEALAVLKGRARIKRTMWSRRAQEYEAKINSGDPLAIAEVVRDLHRNAGQPDQSFSERQIYEAAMDRLAAELAALDETDKPAAAIKLANFLKTV